MNKEQFLEYCINNGIPKVIAIVYCNALKQEVYTETDFKVLKNSTKQGG